MPKKSKTVNSPAVIDQLVRDNIKLARFFALKYAARIDYDEAFSRSMEGLLRAAELFDFNHGAKFGAFAAICIKSKLHRVFTDRLRVKRGRGMLIFSLDDRAHPDFDPMVDTIADESRSAASIREGRDDIAGVREWVDRLPNARWRHVITRRFGLDGHERQTLEEIGLEMGCTRERVRQMQKLALARMALWAQQHDRVDEHPGVVVRAAAFVALPAGKKASTKASRRRPIAA